MNNETTELPITRHLVSVTDIVPLNKHTYLIELLAPKETSLDYRAGQYLKLELDVNQDDKPLWLSYTISSRPDAEQSNRVYLIIQRTSEFSSKVIRFLTSLKANKQPVNIMLGLGKAFLQTKLDKPHLFVAAGSGISKIKCITEEILHKSPETPIDIYWSNRCPEDFFLLELFHEWATQYRNLRFTEILESAQLGWTGRVGFLYEVIQQDFSDLNNASAYLCGSEKMVYGTIDQLKSNGLEEASCYSDVFEFAPRI
ncbi:CDP-6-deoxy-delta-3,4-glucoseen reductase-like [Vibrio maritimus]|uniref:CDP-6-deoxy-delta-3,4-glucoseen reductase-like n=1 Tax=Vibrio maritimus TaxID=990268 RepID=A0A090TVY5_9VIBR|nr:CDP-6-deoxy-delta-3,4-glucoseen reductase-like [Vibrio maritimus]